MALKIGSTSVSNVIVKKSSVSSAVNLVYVKQGNTTTTVFVKQPTIKSAKCWTDSSGGLLYSATVTVTNPCDKALTCYILARDSLGVIRDTVSFSINARTTMSHDIGLSSTDGDGSAVSWGDSSVVAYLEDTNGCESLRTESNFTYEEKVYGELVAPTGHAWISYRGGTYAVNLDIINSNNVNVTATGQIMGISGGFDFAVNALSSAQQVVGYQDTSQEVDVYVYFKATGYTDSDSTTFTAALE